MRKSTIGFLADCCRCVHCFLPGSVNTPPPPLISLVASSDLFLQLGEVKGFIRLLQDDDDDNGDDTNAATTAAQGEGSSSRRSSTAPTSSSGVEVFLTLPALEAFVEGGDAFLARKERAALARRQSQEALVTCARTAATLESTKEVNTGEGESASRPRISSWAAAVDSGPECDGGDAHGKGGEKEGPLLARLRATLARAITAAATSQNGNDAGRNGDTSLGEDGVRGHLDSFDVDGDGVLQPGELVAALRSLGARGGEFFGRSGVNALVSRFRDGGEKSLAVGALNGASVVKIAVWFHEQESTEEARSAVDAAAIDRRSSNSGGSASNGALSGGKAGDKREGGVKMGTERGSVAGEALRRAVRLAEAKGVSLERTFARLDDDGDGFITLRQLLRGLDQLGVFAQVVHAYSS